MDDSKSGFWGRRQLIRECGLSTAQKWLLTIFADLAGDSGWAFPSQETLAAYLSLSIRRTQQLIAELRVAGIVGVDRSNRRNRYRICWDRIGATRCASDAHSSARQQAQSSAPRTSHGNIQRKTHRGNGASRTNGGWSCGGIAGDELSSWDAAAKRFYEAVANGWVHPTDRLRFLTLWQYASRQSRRTNGKRLANPGAFITARIKQGNWQGTDDDEATARAFEKTLEAETLDAPEAAIQLAEAFGSMVRIPDQEAV